MVFEIGNPNGRIALYLDKEQAVGLASLLPMGDSGYLELMDAVENAYPEEETAE